MFLTPRPGGTYYTRVGALGKPVGAAGRLLTLRSSLETTVNLTLDNVAGTVSLVGVIIAILRLMGYFFLGV